MYCTVNGYNVSYTSGTGVNGYRLNVSSCSVPVQGNGKQFDTYEDAKQYAMDYGYIKVWTRGWHSKASMYNGRQ